VAEPHAPMAADERAASAAAVAAEQSPEQAAALVVEPSPAMRVSMTRLMLEELPQLVDEDFNTQESIFTTLANRSTSLHSCKCRSELSGTNVCVVCVVCRVVCDGVSVFSENAGD
jgi:hypothetical protein